MKNLGMIPKLLIAIVLGIVVGQLTFLPDIVFELIMTISGLFSKVLNFILPLMVIAFIVGGIIRLTTNAGKMLGLTLGIAFASLLLAAALAFVTGQAIFPSFISSVSTSFGEGSGIEPLFEFGIEPFFTVAEATVFAFIIGIAISYINSKGKGETIRKVFIDYQEVISTVISGFILPCIPFYVFSNFMNMSYAGSVAEVFSVFAPVYLLIIVQHFVYILITYGLSSSINKVSFVDMIKNAIPAYLTAFGTQSSAASIPSSIKAARSNNVDEEVAEFAMPLTATTHLPGSMISVTNIILAVVMLTGGDSSVAAMIPFYLTLALALVAAPGVPGGAIMTALPYIGMVGLPLEGAIPSLLITLYLTQDSFGTAINVSGDQHIAQYVQKYYNSTRKDREAKKEKSVQSELN